MPRKKKKNPEKNIEKSCDHDFAWTLGFYLLNRGSACRMPPHHAEERFLFENLH